MLQQQFTISTSTLDTILLSQVLLGRNATYSKYNIILKNARIIVPTQYINSNQ